MKARVPWAALGLLCLLAGLPACATAHPTEAPAAVPEPLPHEPSLADFAEGDRDAVAAMLRETPSRFRSPYTVLPGSRAATLLLTCRVESVQAKVVGVRCLSAGQAVDLAVDERTEFFLAVDWAQREFGVSAGTLAPGDVRTCVVHGSGFGGKLWKRFLVFAGPAHGTGS